MVSALLEENNGNRQTGFEAISSLVQLMVTSGSGTLNVYKLSKDLTLCIHALLQGEILYKAQELKLIDIKMLLEKIKSDQMNGCLRIYTDDRSAIIFYKDGNPLGFFHDGSHDIETSSTESQKIAGLPGAKIDLYSTHGIEEVMGIDLLEVVNIQVIWDTAISLNQKEKNRARHLKSAIARWLPSSLLIWKSRSKILLPNTSERLDEALLTKSLPNRVETAACWMKQG